MSSIVVLSQEKHHNDEKTAKLIHFRGFTKGASAIIARSGVFRRHLTDPQPVPRRFLLPPTDEHWREPGLIVSYESKAPLLANNARNGAPKRHSKQRTCGPGDSGWPDSHGRRHTPPQENLLVRFDLCPINQDVLTEEDKQWISQRLEKVETALLTEFSQMGIARGVASEEPRRSNSSTGY